MGCWGVYAARGEELHTFLSFAADLYLRKAGFSLGYSDFFRELEDDLEKCLEKWLLSGIGKNKGLENLPGPWYIICCVKQIHELF